MSKEKIIDQIRKLMLLADVSRGATEGEATNAAQAAQRLLLQHQLSIEEIELRESGTNQEKIERVVLFEAKVPSQWKYSLCKAVAKSYLCRNYFQPDWYLKDSYNRYRQRVQRWTRKPTGKMYLVGRPTNIGIAQEMYHYLEETVERLAQAAIDEAKLKATINGDRDFQSKRFSDSWRKGCVERLDNRLRQQLRNMESQGISATPDNNSVTALAVVSLVKEEGKAIDNFYKELGIKFVTKSYNGGARDHDAYYQGYQAGSKINLDKKIGGSAQKALGD